MLVVVMAKAGIDKKKSKQHPRPPACSGLELIKKKEHTRDGSENRKIVQPLKSAK